MVRSGRVLRASVKSPIYCTVNQMTLVHMVFSREVFSCAFCTKLPSYTEALRACLSRLKKRPGRLFSHLPGLLFLLKAVTCARSVQVIVEWQWKVREACFSLLWNKMQQFSRHEQLQKYAIKQDAFRKVICENCAGTYWQHNDTWCNIMIYNKLANKNC